MTVRRSPRIRPHGAERGAALLLAMLIVALVASLSATAFWQQWRAWTIEVAEQQRSQTTWVLSGALDWARLILRQDARASSVDHLAEPWAVPLQESQLSTFLAGSNGDSSANTDETNDVALQAFLSGEIHDLQSKLNLRNLASSGGTHTLSEPDWQAWQRLYRALGLPESELSAVAQRLRQALDIPQDNTPSTAPLLPQTWTQAGWLGLSEHSARTLAPYATWLPERTPLNLNTASALALHATIPGLDLAQAQQIVTQRQRSHFVSVNDAATQIRGLSANAINTQQHSTSSRYFQIQGRLRLDGAITAETSTVVRNGTEVRVLWRQRETVPGHTEPRASSGVSPALLQ